MKTVKTIFFITIFSLNSLTVLANIECIDIRAISSESNFREHFEYLKSNLEYYQNWNYNWMYNVSRETISVKLKIIYIDILSLKESNPEVYLLLRDIAHFLYNLENEEYNKISIEHYKEAIALNSKGYRGHWFLAVHYAKSAQPRKAFEQLQIAEKQLPLEIPFQFWEDYTLIGYLSQMPAHATYGINQFKKVTGYSSEYDYIIEKMSPANADTAYSVRDLWLTMPEDSASKLATFLSYPLGLRIKVDSTWGFNLYDYKEGQSQVVFRPPGLVSVKGDTITYTIGLFVKKINNEDRLSGFIRSFTKSAQEKEYTGTIPNYSSSMSFKFQDDRVYSNLGGGRFNIIGIRRETPKRPGLIFESPAKLSDDGKFMVYGNQTTLGRFHNGLFYVFLLDTCKDIYEESFSVFENLIQNQILIE